MTAPNRHRKPRERSGWLRPGVITIVAVAVLAGGGALAASMLMAHASSSGSPSHPAPSPPSRARSSSPALASCREQLVVPAYFYASGTWAQATGSKHAPQDMILDVSGMGAGNAPDPHYATLVDNARRAGITILGYISTVNGQRPITEIESELYNYKTWYGVTSIFYDRVSGLPQDIPYYTQIADLVREHAQGAQVWLNPGDFPDQRYMSIGDVVMVFEGTYAQYAIASIPSWTSKYPASRFAHTIYAATAADLDRALQLAGQRNATHVYVTDGNGSNPYAQLPSYWTQEDSAVAHCGAG